MKEEKRMTDTLYKVFGNTSGPFSFRGEHKNGRWWNGDVLAGEDRDASLVGRVSNGIANFVLEVPAWAERELMKAVESKEALFDGNFREGAWWQGKILTPDGMEIARVEDGVIKPSGGLWPEPLIKRLVDENWIPKNWNSAWQEAQRSPEWMNLCEIALMTGGPILEIAAGPGGGNLSPLLHINPSLPIIVNDIEPRILALWRDYLAQVLPRNSVYFAAFDAASSPLRDDSIPCASSCGGLGSIEGDKDSAIRETFRVIQPGGHLVALEAAFTERTRRSLPEPLRVELQEDPIVAADGWSNALGKKGFEIVRDSVAGSRQLRPDESGLAMRASKYGITLWVEYHYIVAKKSA